MENNMTTKLQIFNDKKVRTVWNADEEDWYFSVVDVVEILSESTQPRKYWNDLKRKLKAEGSQLSEKIGQLKMQSSDGKYYKTDVLNTKGVLRLVQSIPSPKAEPFKTWLAQIGSERLDEIADPEKAITRGREYYKQLGYSDDWIKQRMRSIEVRHNLTDEWQSRGIETSMEYAILTNEMTKAWSGYTVKEYKKLKGLKKESLRDNMTDLELIFNMLAEATTTTLSQQEEPYGLDENRKIAQKGGTATKEARKSIEKAIGRPVVSPLNSSDKKLLSTQKKSKHLSDDEDT
ncbi:MAG: Bro-N domain-containing protein [Christensenellaceae bacterium]|jgi:hypothetical protein